jgi:uncharacterized protein (TIGR02678 family)
MPSSKNPQMRSSFADRETRRAHAQEALLGSIARLEFDEPEVTRELRRFDEDILTWHREHTRWSLDVEDESVRLLREASSLPSRPFHADLAFRNATDSPREARDYACVVWTLWFSQSPVVTGRGTSRGFLLSELAEQIQHQAAAGRGGALRALRLDFSLRRDRSALRRALRLLEVLGVVREEDGSTDAWVERGEPASTTAGSSNAVYRFTDLAISLIAPLRFEAARALAERLRADPLSLDPATLADGQPREVRYWRALLSAPVFLRYDDPVAFDALIADRDRVRQELARIGDWELLVTRYFARLVRPSGVREIGHAVLSTQRSLDQAIFLLCSAVRQAVCQGYWPPPDPEHGCVEVSAEDLAGLFERVAAEHAPHWSEELREARDRFETVVTGMRQAGLLRGPNLAGRVLILPTAALYRASYQFPTAEAMPTPADGSSQLSFLTGSHDGRGA